MRKLSISFFIGSLVFSSAPLHQLQADELTRQAIPRSWIDPLLPEDLPDLKLKDYVLKSKLETARAQVFAGRYKIAVTTLREVKESEADPVDLAVVKASALLPLGRTQEAISLLSVDAIKDQSRVQVMRARALAAMGQLSAAIDLLNTHLKANPNSIAGHYWLGNLCETKGDILGAREAFGWFVPFVEKWQKDRQQFRNPEELTMIGRGLDRWASLNASYQTMPALHNIILSMYLRTYDEIDRGYWPAHTAAAEYYVSHDDEPSAIKELKLAIAGNPQDIPTMVTRARLTLSMYNFDATEAIIAAIKLIDRQSIEAEILLARTLLHERRPADALEPISRILSRQPNNLEALGLKAATAALQLQSEKTTEILKEVEKLDPNNSTAYLEVAEQLGAMRQYPRAAAMYKIAIERAPYWTSARNGLGLLYTQSGDEDFARLTLDAAHSLDPFNYATTNYLRLLDDMAKFARKETAHFVLIYDAKKDPMIPEYFADYLESIYQQVCGQFQFEPPVKTYIEVFPAHDAFSVRTTGSPWIGTVGASTGRVIALVTPRNSKGTMGVYDWARVLRHEFTHTVTLAATDNRIAHWMTEGLAVVEERAPMRWQWVPMLNDAVKKKELFTIENLTWAFVRPKRAMDRQLAYAQSYWICQYIEDTWGHEAILKMLAEFRLGHEQRDVFPKILGKSLTEFQSDFFAWTEKQVAGWGYDEETSKKYEVAKEKAEESIKKRYYDEAVKQWEEIAKMRPMDVLPHTRLAGLYMRKEANEPDKLIRELTELHYRAEHENLYAKKIARVYRDLNKLPEAIKFAMYSVHINPYDSDAHDLLRTLYEKSNNKELMEKEQKAIDTLAQWNVDQKKTGTVGKP